MNGPRQQWLPVLFVALLLSLAALATAGPGFLGEPVPPPRPGQGAEGSAPPTSEATPPPRPDAAPGDERPFDAVLLDVLFVILVAAIGIVATVLLARELYRGVRTLLFERVRRREIERRRATQPPGADTEAEQVRDAVRAGLADLDAGGDARQVVIACWVRLERAAAAAGTARLAADTPGDLVARLLSRHRVSRRSLEQLADAYRRARYAPAEIGQELARAARAALRDLADELGAPVVGTVDR